MTRAFLWRLREENSRGITELEFWPQRLDVGEKQGETKDDTQVFLTWTAGWVQGFEGHRRTDTRYPWLCHTDT